MSVQLAFGLNDIKHYLLVNGGRVEYHQLVKAFRHHLSDPTTQNEARNAFKDYVNRLATVCTHQNQKFLVLRPEFLQQLQENVSPVKPSNVSSNDLPPSDPRPHIPHHSINKVGLPLPPTHNVQRTEPPIGLPIVETRRPNQLNVGPNDPNKPSVMSMISPTHRIISSPPQFISPTSPVRNFSFSHHYNDLSDTPPQPPPRRRNSSAGNKAKIEMRVKHFDDERNGDKHSEETQKDSPSHQIEKLKEIHELSTKTPGRVKERAQKIDKMASLTELKPPMPVNNMTTPTGRPKSRNGTIRDNEDTDSGSVQTLDPLRKKWIISASNCDYGSLVSCLKEEPKLSGFKDFTNGYTALHWAAKFGKSEIIKLIAGSYKLNPNIKSHGGYTPLHLAAMSQKQDIMDLLTRTFGADPNIRDNSGKLPKQYLTTKNDKNVLKQTNGVSPQPHISFGPAIHKSIAARIAAESQSSSTTSFIRIGSLKAANKVKKYTGIGPKSWGSAESIPENNVVKKSKKSKKNAKRYPTPERVRDSDSDSAYGFQ